jgi:glycosyltransferase involved in cell wall biosynthesis
MTAPVRVCYVYANAKREFAAEVADGRASDTTLHGQNHLAELGFDSWIHDPLLTRRRLPGPLARGAWLGRELTLPWELRDADVVLSVLGLLFPLAARLRPRLRVVVLNFGLNLIYRRSDRLRRRVLAESFRSAEAVVCLGESQRGELLELTGLDPERVHTVLAAVDADFFTPEPRPQQGEPYVLAVGKDLSRDYGTLAEAIRPLGVRCEILALQRNVAGVALPPGTRVHDGLAWEELRELYAGAACVVVPQRRDGYPYGSEGGGLTAVLESMAMARPTVVSERGILAEYVQPDRTAVVVPPEDPAALRQAVERVLADEAFADAIGAAARLDVEARLTTRHEAERLAPIFRAVSAR